MLASERKSLEKGLAVKADRRYQTIGTFYDGIYGRKKQDIWKCIVRVGLAAVVFMCMIVAGIIRIHNRDVEKNFVEADDMQEEADNKDFLLAEESGEGMDRLRVAFVLWGGSGTKVCRQDNR